MSFIASGRRRRSADGLSYLDDDEFDMSEDPEMKGLNIVELIDTFLDNNAVVASIQSNETGRSFNKSSSWGRSRSDKSSYKIHLGPGVVPHKLTGSGPDGSVVH